MLKLIGTVMLFGCIAAAQSTIVVANGGLCLDVASAAQGAALIQNSCNGAATQNWQLTPVAGASGTYSIVNSSTGMCVDDPGFATANGTLMQQWSCNGGANQEWTLTPTGGGDELVNVNSGTCLDQTGLQTTVGMQLEIWTCNGGANQQWQLSVPATAPSQAANVGYTNLKFSDDFNSTSTIDINNTQQPGFNWYTNGLAGEGAVSPSNINVANSVLTLGGGPSGNLNITSAIAVPNSPFYVGTVFGNGAYFEASLAFDPAQGANASGWAGWWSLALQHVIDQMDNGQAEHWPGQPDGYTHFIELDFFENFHSPSESYVGKTDYLGTIIDWSGQWNSTGQGVFDFHIQNGNNPFQVGNVDWNQFHTYGTLWVPENNGNPGYVQWFFDNQPGPIIYYKGPIGNPPLPNQPAPGGTGIFTPSTSDQAANVYAILDQQQLVLDLGTDPAWPFRIDWVRVWQKP